MSKTLEYAKLVLDEVKIEPIEKVVKQLFFNYRGGYGVRLTKFGLHIFKKKFQWWEIPISEKLDYVLPKHFVNIERNIKTPYYLNNDSIIVFDPDWAMHLKLMDGDLELLCECDDFYSEDKYACITR